MVRFALNASGSRDAEGTWSSWESGDSYKNRYTLIRSLVWYVEENLYSAYQTVILANGKPAVIRRKLASTRSTSRTRHGVAG